MASDIPKSEGAISIFTRNRLRDCGIVQLAEPTGAFWKPIVVPVPCGDPGHYMDLRERAGVACSLHEYVRGAVLLHPSFPNMGSASS